MGEKPKVLLIDPPWQFRVWSRDTGQGRSAEAHYPTMSLGELKALSFSDVMAPDSAMLMWATFPTLPEALELGKAWGYTYKTVAFTWVKTTKHGKWHMGMGYYTRANSEICLLFTRGKPLKRKAKNVRQLLIAPVRRHSQKPDEQYERIEALFDGPYLEAFARQAWPGWGRWGNEVESTIEIALLPADEEKSA